MRSLSLPRVWFISSIILEILCWGLWAKSVKIFP